MLRSIANRIRNRLRLWLGVHDAPNSEPAAIVPRPGISIAAQVLAKAGEKNLIYRKVEAPKLPTGVIPTTMPPENAMLGPYVALDSEFNAPAYAYANQAALGLGFPGYAYLSELAQRSEYLTASNTIASEMTREWIKLITKGKTKGKDSEEVQAQTANDRGPLPEDVDADQDGDVDGGLEDKIEQLTEAMETFKVRAHFRKIAEVDGLFGRAQLFIDINHGRGDSKGNLELPLCIDKATVPKGSLCGFKVIEPIWTTPYSYNAMDPLAADFYRPRAWFVMGKRVHSDRLLTFISADVPDILKPAYNFGGLSMTQRMESDVYQWLRTRNSVGDLIHNFSVMCLKTDMTNVLSGQPDSPGGLFDRAKFFTQTRDNQGLTLLDFAREDIAAVNVPLAGLDKLMSQFQEHMAAPSHIPLVKLLGITPAGLNASSEGEIKVFYDFVRAQQQMFFAEHLNTVIQLLQLHLFGEIDDAIGFEFVALTSPTVKELSEIRKSDAETAATYIDKGVLDPAEVRERVASDPDSGYDNLNPADVPEPPDMGLLDKQHELGQEGAEADHERGEESAEAAHKRSMKETKAAA